MMQLKDYRVSNAGLKILSGEFVTVEDGTLKHDVIKLSLQIFSYLLMR